MALCCRDQWITKLDRRGSLMTKWSKWERLLELVLLSSCWIDR